MKKRIAILGSTGSIGTHTLEIVDCFPELFSVTTLAAGKNIFKLREQILKYKPSVVSVADQDGQKELAQQFPNTRIETGADGLEACVAHEDIDLVVVGIVGFAAMQPTLTAVRLGKKIALANKEVIITAGNLLNEEIKKSGAQCIPVDSEHNALYQLLLQQPRDQIESVVITASGGPLLRRPDLPLEAVTPEIATKHPNWKMGPKISVDSATLMNKGLELIETHILFGFPPEHIEVWVHPQSIVHGAVWFKDNTCIAQLNKPNMCASIAYALHYPERLPQVVPKLSFKEMRNLEFFEPDGVRFPALNLARQALSAGPSHVIALNALNEMAVQAFLEKRLLFPQITQFIERGLERHPSNSVKKLTDVFEIDEQARVVGHALLRDAAQ